MTIYATPPVRPPISEVYAPVGPGRWVNQISGDVVCWNEERQRFERWNPQNAAWYWWGPTRDRTLAWHLYSAKWNMVDFWVCTVVGAALMIFAAANGRIGVGFVVWGLFILWGLLFSWLHTRHFTAYSLITVIGGLWAIGSMMGHRRHHIPW